MKLYDDLIFIQKNVFDACGLSYTAAVIETESAEYSACQFRLEDQLVQYRLAKITPTKNGQFVTLWKRKLKGPIQPFDVSDKIDVVIVNVIKNNHRGIFVFPAETLVKQDIFSVNNKGGKRAMRVYPPWDLAESKQAEKTQKWQLDYFLETPHSKSVNIQKCNSLIEK
jgi:hypothetical protein